MNGGRRTDRPLTMEVKEDRHTWTVDDDCLALRNVSPTPFFLFRFSGDLTCHFNRIHFVYYTTQVKTLIFNFLLNRSGDV